MADLNSLESLKELDDLELEILFMDMIYKKLKQMSNNTVYTHILLMSYFSVVETLKKYKTVAEELNKNVPHLETINIMQHNIEDFLTEVANNESRAMYVHKSISQVYEFSKEIMLSLKRELVKQPKYEYLKPKLGDL
jgi:hypothetical protein